MLYVPSFIFDLMYVGRWMAAHRRITATSIEIIYLHSGQHYGHRAAVNYAIRAIIRASELAQQSVTVSSVFA